MDSNQFEKYLDILFYQSKYNYTVVKDTNQMSGIDFCVRLTEKTKKDLDKFIRNIIVMFNVILDSHKICTQESSMNCTKSAGLKLSRITI
jgi:hypothetical protein